MKIEERYETKRLDHLGIVAGICQEIGLIEKVNKIVGRSERKVSCGAAVQAMVLNGLGFTSRALYLMPEYLKNKAVEVLVEAGLEAEDFNDDTLGRSLDQLYEKGVTEVFAQVASEVLTEYGIKHQGYHVDSSSFHLHGQYKEEENEAQAIKISYGYSRDNHPELKQVVLNLVTGYRSQLLVWMEVLIGNESDKKRFTKTIKAFNKQLKGGEDTFYVVDSALYSAKNIEKLGSIGWLTRVPKTIAAARRLISETTADLMTPLDNGYAYREVSSNYGGVKQRWLLISSTKAAQREEKSLMRRLKKEEKAALAACHKLKRHRFNCQEDAQAALDELGKGYKYHYLEAKIVPVTSYPTPGRPATGTVPLVDGYRLECEIKLAQDILAQTRLSLGRFVLATNLLDVLKFSPPTILSHYKAQAVSVERGFRFLKDPLFFADSLFLKKPGRIMALTMIMVLALLVYALAERKLRLQLAATAQTLPNQVAKETQSPTLRWIFQLFEGIDLLLIWQGQQLLQRQVLNLKPIHFKVLHLLGPPVLKCYLLHF